MPSCSSFVTREQSGGGEGPNDAFPYDPNPVCLQSFGGEYSYADKCPGGGRRSATVTYYCYPDAAPKADGLEFLEGDPDLNACANDLYVLTARDEIW